MEIIEAFSVGLKATGSFFSNILGIVGVIIIVVGSMRAFFYFMQTFWGRDGTLHAIRLELGRHLVLGLEFLVGKDVLASLISPAFDDLAKLGITVVIRTVLAIFLGREMKEAEQAIKKEQAAQIQAK